MTTAPSLDDTDRRLLALLQEDSSRSNQALADAAHVSPPTAWRRVKALREQGVIRREVALVDPAVAGGIQAVVELSLERPDPQALAAFAARIAADRRVQQAWRLGGNPDLMLVLWLPSMEAYGEAARELFAQDRNLRNVRTYFVTGCLKFDPTFPIAPDAFSGAAAPAP